MKGKTSHNEAAEPSPASLIDARIAALGDWRGEALARIRALIKDADPDIVEAVKWIKPSNAMGVPVWEHDGIVCTGETYKDKVKLTFARGAALKDPSRLFNASLDAGTRRAIDIREGDSHRRRGVQGADPRLCGAQSWQVKAETRRRCAEETEARLIAFRLPKRARDLHPSQSSPQAKAGGPVT